MENQALTSSELERLAERLDALFLEAEEEIVCSACGGMCYEGDLGDEGPCPFVAA